MIKRAYFMRAESNNAKHWVVWHEVSWFKKPADAVRNYTAHLEASGYREIFITEVKPL